MRRKKKKNQKTNRGQENGGGAEVRGRSIPGGNDINAADYNASSPPPVALISLSLSLSPPRDATKSRQVKRCDGSARLLRRSALKVPFAYLAKTRRGEKKMRMRFARRRLGWGGKERW